MLVQRFPFCTFRRDIRRPSCGDKSFSRRPLVQVLEYSPHNCGIVINAITCIGPLHLGIQAGQFHRLCRSSAPKPSGPVLRRQSDHWASRPQHVLCEPLPSSSVAHAHSVVNRESGVAPQPVLGAKFADVAIGALIQRTRARLAWPVRTGAGRVDRGAVQ